MADSSSPLRQLKSVCVYCGSSESTRPEYHDLATRFGEELARRGLRPVYGGLPPVEIDLDMIDRVIINLLDNAIKFTPSGGQISVAAEARADHVAVSIADTGYGIPLEQRPHIFERFSRGTREGPRPRGFGLGLTFCKLAVEAHGGRIWVEDGEGGVGSRLVFTLPLRRGE